MSNSEINLKILKLFFNFKIKPSDFINIYKRNKDIELTADYFSNKENKNLKLFDKDKYHSAQICKNFNSIIKYLYKNNVSVFNISQKEYPELLKEIYFPPPLLFCKGSSAIKNKNLKIAIVGTRNCSDYGKEVAAYLSRQLSKIGFTIVSGMAVGIDKIAHEEAIKESGGSIGVLGTGIDIEYPYESKHLYKEIIGNGSLITEFLPGTPPLKNNFPSRNRIISGISIGVIVIEAGEKSGAIITAKSAIRENREVFAVPGNIFSDKSKGCHNLIKTGAKLTESVDDILEELANYIKNPSYAKSINFNEMANNGSFKLNYSGDNIFKHELGKKENAAVNNNEGLKNFPDEDYAKVYNCLGYKEKSLEEIMVISGLGIKKVLQIISFFQLNNIAKEKNFNNFVRGN
ncbi:DNA-processing protein DprA [bacterium]|nr:DNA-processing protein DprA [bacterium]